MKQAFFAAFASMVLAMTPAVAEAAINPVDPAGTSSAFWKSDANRRPLLDLDRAFFQLGALDSSIFGDIISNAESERIATRPKMLHAITAVPEPEVWALLMLGFAGIGGAMRARHRHVDKAG